MENIELDTKAGIAKSEFTIGEMVSVIKYWIKVLLHKWIQIILGCIIFCTLFLLLAIFSPVTYTSKISFILEEGKSGSGGLASLAGQFGLDISSGSGGTNLLAGDNIIGLLTSRKMAELAILSKFDSVSGGNKTLADVYAQTYDLTPKWEKKLNQKIIFPSKSSHIKYSRIQDSLLSIIVDNILKDELKVERVDKKMSFIRVTTTMLDDEKLNAQFAERLVKEAVSFYVETKTRRQRNNVDRLQNRADSIGSLLNRKTYSSAIAQSKAIDVNPIYSTELVNSEINLRDKSMVGIIYGEIVKNLEIQKITLTQETPVIQVVDEAQLPLQKNKKKKLTAIITGLFIGLIVSSLFIIFKTLKNRKS